MIRWWALCIACLLGTTAFAHIPYIGNPICDGDGWRVHLMFGDGIISADPAAAVVLDTEGRLLAWHYLGIRPFRVLWTDCAIHGPEISQTVEPDPSRFIDGPALLGNGDAARDMRWAYEPTYGSQVEEVGFRTVDAGPFRLFTSEIVTARWQLLLFAVLGGLTVVLGWLWLQTTGIVRVLVAMAGGALGTLFFGLLYLAVVFGDIGLRIGGFTAAVWLGAAGAVVRRSLKQRQGAVHETAQDR